MLVTTGRLQHHIVFFYTGRIATLHSWYSVVLATPWSILSAACNTMELKLPGACDNPELHLFKVEKLAFIKSGKKLICAYNTIESKLCRACNTVEVTQL